MEENFSTEKPRRAIPVPELEAGYIIRNRYEVVGLIGRGASASVYKCLDRKVGNLPVALKVFPASVAKDEIAGQRLNKELRASFAVDHENVARFYDMVRTDTFIGLVMEYVDGGSLDDFLGLDNKPLEPVTARNILLQLCAGLEAIHQAGIVHRDIKPANVVIATTGSVKITDLGLVQGANTDGDIRVGRSHRVAKISDELSSDITVTGDMVGTPMYVSPEYIEHGKTDARSDLYAIGIIGYEMLTKKAAFSTESIREFVRSKLITVPPAPHEVNPTCPVALSKIIMKAMHRDPSARYTSIGEMRRDVQSVQLTVDPALLSAQAKRLSKCCAMKLTTKRWKLILIGVVIFLAATMSWDWALPGADLFKAIVRKINSTIY